MKTTLLSILLVAVLLPGAGAQEEKREPSREGERREAAERDRDRAEKEKVRLAAQKERIQAELAQAKEKLKQHVKAAKEEAAELEKAGKKDEAEARRRDADERLKAAHAELEERMRKLQQNEPRREGGDRRPDGPPRQDLENKLKHVEQAVGHLREAGLADMAEAVSQAANRLRAGLHGEGDRPREEARRDAPRREEIRRDSPPASQNEVEALRREIQELRQAVRQLAEKQAR